MFIVEGMVEVCLVLGVEGGEVCDDPSFLWEFVSQSLTGPLREPVFHTDWLY